MHIPKQKRVKWDAKAELGILVGYDENVKAYRILFPDTNKVELHQDVVFKDELKFLNIESDFKDKHADCYFKIFETEEDAHENNIEPIENGELNRNKNGALEQDLIDENENAEVNADILNNENNENDENNENNLVNDESIRNRLRNRENIRVPLKYRDDFFLEKNICIEELFVSQTCEPITYNEAINSENAIEWQKAM